MKKKTKQILCAAAVILLIAGALLAYFNLKPKSQEGAKTVTVEVVDDKGKTTEYQVHTDAKYITGVLESAKSEGLTFHGEKGEFGLTIDTINGIKADYNTGSTYWAFYLNGEYTNYGPDKQTVSDGDTIKIEYTVWKE